MVERLVNGSWKPFMADDVQMDFVRIDPFIRLTMTPSPEGIFSVKFTVIGIYGYFSYIKYRKIVIILTFCIMFYCDSSA